MARSLPASVRRFPSVLDEQKLACPPHDAVRDLRLAFTWLLIPPPTLLSPPLSPLPSLAFPSLSPALAQPVTLPSSQLTLIRVRVFLSGPAASTGQAQKAPSPRATHPRGRDAPSSSFHLAQNQGPKPPPWPMEPPSQPRQSSSGAAGAPAAARRPRPPFPMIRVRYFLAYGLPDWAASQRIFCTHRCLEAIQYCLASGRPRGSWGAARGLLAAPGLNEAASEESSDEVKT